VAGGTGGLGRAIVRACVADGKKVVVLSRKVKNATLITHGSGIDRMESRQREMNKVLLSYRSTIRIQLHWKMHSNPTKSGLWSRLWPYLPPTKLR
jgi:nucleoside-diphosphate-sugar epimerase